MFQIAPDRRGNKRQGVRRDRETEAGNRERQNGGGGGEHAVKERERDPERCWDRSMGAGLPRLDSGSEFPVVCMTETSYLSSLGSLYSHQNGAGQ